MIGHIVLDYGDRSQQPKPHPFSDGTAFEIAFAL